MWGIRVRTLAFACFVAICAPRLTDCAANLIDDPSFEITKDRDPFGHVFAKWSGWKYDGDCKFEVGLVARTGQTSGLMSCAGAGKIRMEQLHDLQPGRYQITAYIRGMDIGTGTYGADTEFMFNDKYTGLKKHGTFGWTRLTYVADVDKPAQAGPSFGLWAPGLFWIDDVTMELVGKDVKLTPEPVLGNEEAPIAPPEPIGAGAVRCPKCGYRNMPAWKKCYACGTPLEEAKESTATGPAVKPITSFEDGNPFGGGTVVAAHATDGTKALRIDRGYVAMIAPQNWAGYDYLKIDMYADSQDALAVGIEIQDRETKDYWTRVNYNSVAPPGASTLIVPLKSLYVGEKGRPGRNLILDGITRLVVLLNSSKGSLYIDRLRVERDTSTAKVFFEGLHAFSFGPGGSAPMEGFTPITPGTNYNEGRGYGLKNARIWRSFDVLEPDPLYENFICIESGGLAVDVPNGNYRVFVNVDAPGGFWGENQIYRERSILAQGKKVVSETLDYEGFKKKYFHFWDTEDLPTDDVFEKYGSEHFKEKTFDVAVTNGQLFLEFQGQTWANAVSAVIIFPVEKAAEGARFLDYVKERRRFYFENAFKRALPRPTGDPVQPTAEDARRGYLMYQRDLMGDCAYNSAPVHSELGKPIAADAFAGEAAPVLVGILPLKDLGRGEMTVSALDGPQGEIPASSIDVGYYSNRIIRSSSDGAVYTIAPRLVLPRNYVAMPQDTTRYFFLTVHTPAGAAPGVYTGKVTFQAEKGEATQAPVRFTVRRGELDAMDIPAGPFGGGLGTPWPADDPASAAYDADMKAKSLRLLRERGFTLFTGVPWVEYQGFASGKPTLDFRTADRQMQQAKDLGFLAVDSYGSGVSGFDNYFEDTAKMKAAGFSDYSEFIKTVYTAVEEHAEAKGWLPVYWNIGDEPSGEDLKRSAVNATAYGIAFPGGPPYFTAATSLAPNTKVSDPDFMLARALQVATLGDPQEASINLLRKMGGQWAHYNGGSRWTYGAYLYKAAKEFGLKFRVAWHWNSAAGDPYYALDCREDDFAWATAGPDGELIPTLAFEQIAAGLGDYRRLLTLARLAKAKAATPAAQAAEALINGRMAAFHLSDRDHDRLFGAQDWVTFREQASAAIEALQ